MDFIMVEKTSIIVKGFGTTCTIERLFIWVNDCMSFVLEAFLANRTRKWSILDLFYDWSSTHLCCCSMTGHWTAKDFNSSLTNSQFFKFHPPYHLESEKKAKVKGTPKLLDLSCVCYWCYCTLLFKIYLFFEFHFKWLPVIALLVKAH